MQKYAREKLTANELCQTKEFDKFYNEFLKLWNDIIIELPNKHHYFTNRFCQVFLLIYLQQELSLSIKIIAELTGIPEETIQGNKKHRFTEKKAFDIYEVLSRALHKYIRENHKEFVISYENFYNKYKEISFLEGYKKND